MEIGSCEVPKLMFQVVEKYGNLENFKCFFSDNFEF
jgi:hypothetical protein